MDQFFLVNINTETFKIEHRIGNYFEVVNLDKII